jgi:serine/threonine protein kinase
MSSHPFPPAARVGKYEVLSHVATGGMGAVYKAIDADLNRIVALKVLAARLVDNPAAVERFRREARNAARLNHPNIVMLYEWGKEGDAHYLAMEFVDGPDLGEYILNKGRLDVEETHAILVQAVQALDHAHRQGVVHRDIKPSNFILARQDGELVVKMTDLGLSRAISDEDFRVTRDGSTVGTVDYLSPEQSRDSSGADIRSDIYSLGCTVYHMLAGHPPFDEGGLGERVYKHMHTEPPDLRKINPDVPSAFWGVVKRMLAKAPGARYQTPAALLHDLQHLSGLTTSPEDTPPTSLRRLPEAREPAAAQRDSDGLTFDGSDEESAFNVSSPEERTAAARQFERASEVLAVGDGQYARSLLLTCCTLDPANLRYRQTLRQVKPPPGGLFSSLTDPLKNLLCKAHLNMAQRKGDHIKVLSYGEEVIAHAPGDVAAQLKMARAAESLGLLRLSFWLAEQSRAQDSHNPAPLRALARLYERQKQFSRALRFWELVHQEAPSDGEAKRKMNDLAAQETIERGNYKGRVDRSAKRRGKPPTDF